MVMYKRILIISALVLLSIFGVWFSKNNEPNTDTLQQQQRLSSIISPSPSSPFPEVNFTALFEIYTNGTKRIFTEPKYHHQSSDVYIETPDPSIIHIKKLGTTWDEFFKTLPFSLTKECLVTGTKQTFCSNETKKLRFFLNGVEKQDALDYEIKENDTLKITYGN